MNYYSIIKKFIKHEIDKKLEECIKSAISSISFKGDSNNKTEVNEYCISRLAEGINDYICSSNYNSVFRQRLYFKYCSLIRDICAKCKIYDYEKYIDILEVPIVSDAGIELVKSLHSRKGKSKEELASELGVSERMVRLDIRKLDPAHKENSDASCGEFRLGGHAMHVPVKTVIGENGKKYMYTPNTLHPISLQMNLYQTIILLESLMKEYYEESVVAIMLAATIWDQLSNYAKERIIKVYKNKNPENNDFIDFIDEIEDWLKDGENLLFRTEKEMKQADWMTEEEIKRIEEKHNIR